MFDLRRRRRGYSGLNRDISSMEIHRIDELLAENRRMTEAFDGEYKASWLLSNWADVKWVTNGGNKTMQVDGLWVRTVDIRWDFVLPNGALFTDPQYAAFLNIVKKIAFLYRQGFHGGKAPGISTWISFCQIMLCIVRWMVLENKRYHVEEYGFSLLDQAGLNRLYSLVGKDGWTGALRIVERSLVHLYLSTFNENCPQQYLEDPTNLPLSIAVDIGTWLKKNGGIGTRDHSNCVSRKFISAMIASPDTSASASSARLTSFLRQFEPKMASKTGLLKIAGQQTEYPSHRTPTLIDATAASATSSPVKRLNTTLSTILSISNLLPDDVPDGSGLSLEHAKAIGLQHSDPEGHTPFMPLDIGLKYLNEAMRWVHVYGDAIVDYYLNVVIAMRELNDGGSLENWEISPEKLSKIHVPVALRTLGFQGKKLRRPPDEMDFAEFRANPTLTNLLQVWAGAVATLIACMKPPRSSELQTLRRNCLLGSGPYYLDTELAKRRYRDERAMTNGKPIPTIVARAIKQMQRLGDGLITLVGETDKYHGSLLFYLPYATHTFGRTKKANAGMLNRVLDRFCDFVALPLDELGRRWYSRIHEWRKWFLLLLFWSARFGALDAARDIAGHVDAAHLQVYIEREFPELQFSSLEAEWAVDRLRIYDKTGISRKGEKIEDMYRKVLSQFKATDLEMIPSQEWIDYVNQMRADDEFHLRPYAFVDASGNINYVVAFQSFRYQGDS